MNSVKRYVFYDGAILFLLGFTAVNIKWFLTKDATNIERFVYLTCSASSSTFRGLKVTRLSDYS